MCIQVSENWAQILLQRAEMQICAVRTDRMDTSDTSVTETLVYFQIKTKTLAGSLLLIENKQAYVITAWHMLNPTAELRHRTVF